MKLAITAAGMNLDAPVDPRFGRCQAFVLVDPETLAFEAVPNPAVDTGSGAGIQAAQTLVDQGVTAVLTDNIGPNAQRVLAAAGIKIYTGIRGTVRDAIGHFQAGLLPETESATVSSHFGLGRQGGGQGRGRGGNW